MKKGKKVSGSPSPAKKMDAIKKVPIKKVGTIKSTGAKRSKKMADERDQVGTAAYTKAKQEESLANQRKQNEGKDAKQGKQKEKKKTEEYKLGSGKEGEEKQLEEQFQRILTSKREYSDADQEVSDAEVEQDSVNIDALKENRARILSRWQQEWSEFKRLFEVEMNKH